VSAAWRSSSIATDGRVVATLRRKPVTASKRQNRAASGLTDGGAGSPGNSSWTSGRICATWEAPVPSWARSVSGGPSRSSARSTCTHGQYAGAPPASQQRPQRTRKPRVRAAEANSSASQLFPIPGSPARTKSRPRPEAASSRPVKSASISRSRPTNAVASGDRERWSVSRGSAREPIRCGYCPPPRELWHGNPAQGRRPALSNPAGTHGVSCIAAMPFLAAERARLSP
jgi:hypothetical protein